MTILVTGFDPFGGEVVNPAYEAVKQLPDTIKGHDVIKLEIPTVFGKSGQTLVAALEKYQPELVLCVGQAGGRTDLSFEKVAINFMEARIPDNEGKQPFNQPVISDGATAYFTNLPIKAMAKAVRESGILSSISYTAGTFVCNELMYHLLHWIDTHNVSVRGGFVHVPFAPEQAAQKSGVASMSIDMISQGLYEALAKGITVQEDIEENTGITH